MMNPKVTIWVELDKHDDMMAAIYFKMSDAGNTYLVGVTHVDVIDDIVGRENTNWEQGNRMYFEIKERDHE
ncbi:MAG: hypothetical protein GY833_16570 [Aestuariibacter sp.]|nr:hypothetical protein [Aestuariibacter sp.]